MSRSTPRGPGLGAVSLRCRGGLGQDGDTRGKCDRYDRLHDESAAQFGRINVPAIEKMLSRVAQGNMTLQSMVFEPSNRVMYLATGANAASREFYRIDLKAYFR